MDHSFHHWHPLSKREEVDFRELSDRLGPVPSAVPVERALGWPTRVRLAFWRHLALSALLVPIGIATLMVAVVTWWPIGLLGAPLIGVGELAVVSLLEVQRVRYGLRRHVRQPDGPC